ncbi:MAG: phospholipase C, phosphocholine-specific, partial [Candidatus Dormibacteraeota bacterium]|nr:phospholipase C, phosphocholine-specific [Candidatus Dormibacteraeota bacterium]
LLQARGIGWYVYQEADNDTNNVLPLFSSFNDTTTDLYRRGNSIIPTPAGQRYGPALAAKLKTDVLGGNLPQVSWILASTPDCEHPSAAPNYGARFVASILDALTADPSVWAKTLLFYTFDENDGFFDHVVPPTPPQGTAGEYLPAQYVATNPSGTLGWSGPVGLSIRVPMIVISPFTRGGFCATQTFDHTSLLLFLEQRFGVEVPNITAWRRQTVGDLTSAINFAGGVDTSVPMLPDAGALAAAADSECGSLPAPVFPASQTVPTQESGSQRPEPSGRVAPANTPEAPVTPLLLAGGAAAALAALASRRTR